MNSVKKIVLPSMVILASLVDSTPVLAQNVVTRWNDITLQAIRNTKPAPPVIARALAITHTCMFDAWAAYDAKALGTRLGATLRRPAVERTAENKNKAISFAAKVCLTDLFPTQALSFNKEMSRLGYNPNEKTSDCTNPANIGKKAAKAIVDFRHYDGSNQLGDLHPGAYSDYTGYKPVNIPTTIIDPDHWQPLLVNGKEQKFIAPHWGKVKPYALKAGNQFRALMPEPISYKKNPVRYEMQAKEILEQTAHLTDEKKAIAEYWADGPASEAPPGHWSLFAKYISERDHHTVDQDIKMFFALTNATFDASIACWDAKRFFDYVRPVTAINFLYTGQTVMSWNGLIDGADWRPYQAKNLVTPSFAEYGSGHSTFSAAAAETLKLFTRNDYFGYSVKILEGSSRVEPGVSPANDITLYWQTFSDAAAEAGISRRYGGIHFVDGDLESRRIGRRVARQAWAKSWTYFGN